MKQIKTLTLDEVIPDPHQPRQSFDPFAMKRLKESIEQYGILNPLAVEKQKDGTYLLIDGERRWRTAKELKLKELPCIIYEPLDLRARLSTRFHLQDQHTSWSMWDKANVVLQLKNETGVSVKEIAQMLGISDTVVGQYLAVNALSKNAFNIFNEKKIPFGFISRIGLLVKNLKEVKYRSAIENALIKKVQNHVIVKEFEISRYALAIKNGGEKVINAIVKDDYLTAEGAMRLARIGGQLVYNHIIFNATYCASEIQHLKSSGGFNCKPSDAIRLREASKKFEKLADEIEKLTS